jgi:hypothetical protein
MARPTIPLQWTKDDPDGKARFERAVKKVGGTAVSVARALCNEWASLILAADDPAHITRAAKKFEKRRRQR